MESDTPNVEAALKASQDNCEGKTYTVLWNVIFIAIASNILVNVITSVWISLTFAASYQVANLGSYLAYGVVTSFTVLFYYVLKTQIEKLHGEAGHAAHHSAPTGHHNS